MEQRGWLDGRGGAPAYDKAARRSPSLSRTTVKNILAGTTTPDTASLVALSTVFEFWVLTGFERNLEVLGVHFV
ncbi:hypothetical protein CFN78_25520 [Amycolatopsis antarctica]|uniref:Uncharacterized protein n=1 Tax=Amycolatopsis antarctica TaxID=1854586 RepID=A0A263CVY0_9PSEU|nr:hypothetical protein CFN78_25520 [Amycolatopsis antarctica]